MGSHSGQEMEREIKPIFQADNKKLVALIKGNHEVYFAKQSGAGPSLG
jgi:hypothetical protein